MTTARLAKLLTLSTGLVFATATNAKSVCSGVKMEQDKFGGGTSATSVVQALSQLRIVGIIMQSKSGQTTMNVTVKEGGALNGGVAAGSQVLFSFDDGTVLTLATAQDASFQSYVGGGAIMTNVPYSFALTPAELDLFAGKTLTAMRVPLMSKGTTYDLDINGGIQKKLLSTAQCFKTL